MCCCFANKWSLTLGDTQKRKVFLPGPGERRDMFTSLLTSSFTIHLEISWVPGPYVISFEVRHQQLLSLNSALLPENGVPKFSGSENLTKHL